MDFVFHVRISRVNWGLSAWKVLGVNPVFHPGMLVVGLFTLQGLAMQHVSLGGSSAAMEPVKAALKTTTVLVGSTSLRA